MGCGSSKNTSVLPSHQYSSIKNLPEEEGVPKHHPTKADHLSLVSISKSDNFFIDNQHPKSKIKARDAGDFVERTPRGNLLGVAVTQKTTTQGTPSKANEIASHDVKTSHDINVSLSVNTTPITRTSPDVETSVVSRPDIANKSHDVRAQIKPSPDIETSHVSDTSSGIKTPIYSRTSSGIKTPRDVETSNSETIPNNDTLFKTETSPKLQTSPNIQTAPTYQTLLNNQASPNIRTSPNIQTSTNDQTSHKVQSSRKDKISPNLVASLENIKETNSQANKEGLKLKEKEGKHTLKNKKTKTKTDSHSYPGKYRKDSVVQPKIQYPDPATNASFPRHEYEIKPVDPESGLENVFSKLFEFDGPMVIEDSFWPRKRALIPDYDVMRSLDRKVKEVPKRFNKDAPELVKHMIKGLRTCIAKYRILFRWIADNIDYDCSVLTSGSVPDSSPQAVLNKGRAVCGGYSNLYAEFCRLADLRCDTLHGYSKGVGYTIGMKSPPTHAWSVIYIDDEPFNCDCTWAAGSVDSKDGRNYQFQRQWKEANFLAEPKAFLNTHLPLEDNDNRPIKERDIRTDIQIIEYPYLTFESWNNDVIIGNNASVLNAEIITKDGISYTDTNEAEFCIRFKRAALLYSRLTPVSSGTTRGNLDNNVMYYWTGNLATIKVQLPTAGRYELAIVGKSSDSSNSELQHAAVATYVIVGTGSTKHKGFPEGGLYGTNPVCMANGYFCINVQEQILNVENGRATIEFAYPFEGKMMCTVHENKTKMDSNESLKERTYKETFSSKIAFHVALPRNGTYLFKAYSKKPNETNGYELCCMLILRCRGLKKETSSFGKAVEYGPRPTFVENELSVEGLAGHTIRTTNGEATFSLLRPRERTKQRIMFTLLRLSPPQADAENEKCKRFIFAEYEDVGYDKQRLKFNLRFSQAGYFALNVFVEGKHVGTWFVSSGEPSSNPVFPTHHGFWGAREDGPLNTLKGVSFPYLPHIEAPNGNVTLGLKIPRNLFAVSNLKGKNKDTSLKDMVTFEDMIEKECIQFDVKLGENIKGARFELFIGPRGERLDYAGVWYITPC